MRKISKSTERTIWEFTEGETIWDTRNIADGVYMYKLLREGQSAMVGKFVIQH